MDLHRGRGRRWPHLAAQVATSRHPAAKQFLKEHPVKASWKDATDELLEQYEEAIEANRPHRQKLSTIVSGIDTLVRTLLVMAFFWWCLKSYTNKAMDIVGKLTEDLLN